MKFFKLSLLVLPLFVFADNPILPADIDAAQETPTQETAEIMVQEEPAKALPSDSEAESNYQQETPRDFVLLSAIFAILILPL
tara:strand:+ start:81 stop:329 length:249 start_codon:yes stop_codon:yes gene_type:complete